MARVTVEDCLKNVDSRFDLVLQTAKRARAIAMGSDPLVEWENDKPTVVALREVAAGLEPVEVKSEEQELYEALTAVDAEDTTEDTGSPTETPGEA